MSTLFRPDSNAFFYVLGARNYKYLLTYNQVVYLDFTIARCFIFNAQFKILTIRKSVMKKAEMRKGAIRQI
jgi:hypothetical protein